MTIEQEWQDFRSFVYPTVEEDCEQMRQLKACWFSAYISCLGVVQKLAEKEETEAVDSLEALTTESSEYIKNYVKEESERQRK